jgi:hypothetical protein
VRGSGGAVSRVSRRARESWMHCMKCTSARGAGGDGVVGGWWWLDSWVARSCHERSQLPAGTTCTPAPNPNPLSPPSPQSTQSTQSTPSQSLPFTRASIHTSNSNSKPNFTPTPIPAAHHWLQTAAAPIHPICRPPSAACHAPSAIRCRALENLAPYPLSAPQPKRLKRPKDQRPSPRSLTNIHAA